MKIIDTLKQSGITKSDILSIFKSDLICCSTCHFKPFCFNKVNEGTTCTEFINNFLETENYILLDTKTILYYLNINKMFKEVRKNKYINVSGIQTRYKKGDILKRFVDYETFIVYTFLESCNAYILEDKTGLKIAVTQEYVDFNLYKLEESKQDE